MKLNDPIIKAAKSKEKPYKLTDGHGLVLLVSPNGSKWWRYRFMYHGREQMLSLGVYPDVTLARAREFHQAARKLIKQGVNPAEQRRREKAAMTRAIQNTFKTVSMEWWDYWHVGKSERHTNATMRSLEHNLFPTIGERPIDQINAPVLIQALKPIEQRSPDTARRLLDVSRMIFRYAVAHGRTDRNPANDFAFSDVFKTEAKTNYSRVDVKQLPDLLRKIDGYQGSDITRLALIFMSLVFVRTRELTCAKWEEIDLDAALWRIPSDRMKMRYPHLVPLSRQSIEILKQIKKLTGGGQYIFPGEKDPDKPMHFNTMLYGLYKLGFQSKMTTHGFRGIASTILNEQGFNQKIIEIQLAHLTGSATQRAYDHAKHLPERAEMMQWWADYLEGLK